MIEARRFIQRLPPRAWAIMALAALILAGAVQVAPTPGNPSDGLYIVHVEPDSPYRDAANHPSIRQDGAADAWLADDVRFAPGERGTAVHTVLYRSYQESVDAALRQEADQSAAFPVSVNLHFVTRDLAAAAAEQVESPEPEPTAPSESSPTESAPEETAPTRGSEPEPNRTADSQLAATPRDIEPPFPIRSLLLSFAYIIPASLLMQLHGANLHAERTKGRARVLLSTPLGPARLLWQKAAPFALLLLLIDVGVTLALGAGWLGFLAAGAVLALLLSMTTFMALWARSPRELGMLNVGATTMLNVFLFLPAMFPSIPPVAYLSPIHVVAQGMAGVAVPFAALLYAVVPAILASIALVALAIAMTTEELWLGDGFRIPEAIRRASPGWKTLPAGVLVVPFVFVLQLTVLVTLTVLGLNVALWFALPASVLIEEVAKFMVARGRTWGQGALTGAGFFIGEKTALLLTLVGFQSLPYGQQALALLGSGTGFLMLAAPLALHVVTGLMLTRGRLGFLLALGVHFGYDQILLAVAA